MSKNKSECVRVVIRCRPLNSTEKGQGFKRVVEMDVKRGTINVANPKAIGHEPPRTFTFDSVYNWDSKQRDLYDETFHDLVESVLDGFNGTIFAYGQTGTGKTHTMQGIKTDPEMRGVIPNSFEQIFSHIGRSSNQQYLVRASYLEIYQEEIRDLLSKNHTKRLELKERPDTGVYVKDLSSFVTKSVKEIEHVMNVGNQNRAVGATNMNEHSSRSHAIFLVTIECGQVNDDGESHIRVGKLNMVDLAGSERQAKTGSTGDRLKEATKINLSLSALGNVISALVDGKSTHIPYRDSKLTRLLQDSLGGNAKTVMVANIGPADYNYDETVNTLRYANRAKNIKNKPRINEDPKDALLREFQEEIARLRAQLDGKGGPKKKKPKTKKRRIRVNEHGEEEEVWESDEEGDDDEENVEEYMKQQQEKLEKEKEAIMSNKNLLAEERDRLIHQKEKQEQKLMAEQEAKEALSHKIKAMESKLLVGGLNIIDHTNEQQRQLEQKRQEMLRQEKAERELKQQLDKKEESALNLQETYSSLQQEVEIKTKKLKKLFAKMQEIKQEMADLQEAHIRERQELEETQEELTRDLKLRLLFVENFVPPEEKTKLVSRAVFDEDEDMWRITPISQNEGAAQMSKRPVSACGNRQPLSEYAKMAAGMGGNPRYKGENIINVELDLPSRTTRDYEGPDIAPGIADALNTALREEDDLLIDGSPAVFSSKAKTRSSKKKSSVLKKHKPPDDMVFPSSRGLVPK